MIDHLLIDISVSETLREVGLVWFWQDIVRLGIGGKADSTILIFPGSYSAAEWSNVIPRHCYFCCKSIMSEEHSVKTLMGKPSWLRG